MAKPKKHRDNARIDSSGKEKNDYEPIFFMNDFWHLITNPNSKWATNMHRFEKSFLFHVGALILFGFTLFNIVNTTYSINQELTTQRETRIDIYRNTILKQEGGNNGKGNAITRLAQEGVDLQGLRVICPHYAIVENKCTYPQTITGLVLSEENTENIPRYKHYALPMTAIFDWHVEWAEFFDFFIEKLYIDGSFSNVSFFDGSIIGSDLSGLSNAKFENTILENTRLILEPDSLIEIYNSDISGLTLYFDKANDIDISKIIIDKNNFARADRPPRCEILNEDSEQAIDGSIGSQQRTDSCNVYLWNETAFCDIPKKLNGGLRPDEYGTAYRQKVVGVRFYGFGQDICEEIEQWDYRKPIDLVDAKKKYPNAFEDFRIE